MDFDWKAFAIAMVFSGASIAAASPCSYPRYLSYMPQDGATVPSNAMLFAFGATGGYTLSVPGTPDQVLAFGYEQHYLLGSLPGLTPGSSATVVINDRPSDVTVAWNIVGPDVTAPGAPGLPSLLDSGYQPRFDNKACHRPGFYLRLEVPPASDDVGIAAFHVYRSVGGNLTLVGAEFGTPVRVDGLTPQGRSCFVIKAVDYASNEGPPSPEVCVDLVLPEIPDAGAVPVPDAESADTGPMVDAGIEQDSGVERLDGGPPLDGAHGQGAPVQPAGGCGCAASTSGDSTVAWWILLLLAPISRRVRREAPQIRHWC